VPRTVTHPLRLDVLLGAAMILAGLAGYAWLIMRVGQ
jgi:hypothetical protein